MEAAWTEVQAWGDSLDGSSRLVACRWGVVPRLDDLIDDVIRTFAGVALADWPHWYGMTLVDPQTPSALEQIMALQTSLRHIARQQLHVLSPWLRKAAAKCIRREPPFDSNSPREVQAGQLALAVCPQNLTVVLCTSENESTGAAALVAAAEWLQRVTGARIILLTPTAWKNSSDLHRLHAEPKTLSFQEPPPTDPFPAGLPSGVQVHVTPQPGLPHPNSEAEGILYQRIQGDKELSACLQFNQTVEVNLGQKFRIDILCRSRRVAVEVDGDDHRALNKYCDDCNRDYRLMLNGYLVLRLPNTLVQSDPDLAIHRIRDLLHFREGIAT